MKPIFILASGFQKKWDAKLTIAFILIFLTFACKKEEKFTAKRTYPTHLVYKDLVWSESPVDSGFQLQVPALPEPYSLDRLVGVFLVIQERHCPFLSNRKHCMDLSDGVISMIQELAKDGNTSRLIYYTIRNGEVVVYVKWTNDSFFRSGYKESVELRFK